MTDIKTADTVIPIPLRADLTVYVQGLPMDMTEREATKIARVILAFQSKTDGDAVPRSET